MLTMSLMRAVAACAGAAGASSVVATRIAATMCLRAESFICVPGWWRVPTHHGLARCNAKVVPTRQSPDFAWRKLGRPGELAAIAGPVKVLLTGGGRICRSGQPRPGESLDCASTASDQPALPPAAVL